MTVHRQTAWLATVVLASCTCNVRVVTPGRILGEDVVPVIERAVARLHAKAPDIAARDIDCPESLNLADGGHGLCHVTVEGKSVEVEVWLENVGDLNVLLHGTLIELGDTERFAAAQAAALGSPETTTDCGAPKVRFVTSGDSVTCVASRPGFSHAWKLDVTDLHGTIYYPKTFPVGPDAATASSLARLEPLLRVSHRVVMGSDIEAYLLANWNFEEDAAIQTARCPTWMNLSDGEHAFCTVVTDGQELRLRIDVDSGTWRVQPEGQALLMMSRVEHDLEVAAADVGRQQGLPAAVFHVDCGKQRVEIASFPVRKTCDLTLPDSKHIPTTLVIDHDGGPARYFFGDPKDIDK